MIYIDWDEFMLDDDFRIQLEMWMVLVKLNMIDFYE